MNDNWNESQSLIWCDDCCCVFEKCCSLVFLSEKSDSKKSGFSQIQFLRRLKFKLVQISDNQNLALIHMFGQNGWNLNFLFRILDICHVWNPDTIVCLDFRHLECLKTEHTWVWISDKFWSQTSGFWKFTVCKFTSSGYIFRRQMWTARQVIGSPSIHCRQAKFLSVPSFEHDSWPKRDRWKRLLRLPSTLRFELYTLVSNVWPTLCYPYLHLWRSVAKSPSPHPAVWVT